MNLRDAHAIRDAVNSGKVSAREIAESALQRIEAVDRTLNAFLTLDPARSMCARMRLIARCESGRFHWPACRSRSRIISALATCVRHAAPKFWSTISLPTAPRNRAFGGCRAIIIGKSNAMNLPWGLRRKTPHLKPRGTLRPGARFRREQRRQRSGSGCGDGVHGIRIGNRRIRPPAGVILQCRRVEAYLRQSFSLRFGCVCIVSGLHFSGCQ